MDDNRNGTPLTEGERLVGIATGVLMAWLGTNAVQAESRLRGMAESMEMQVEDVAKYLIGLAEHEAEVRRFGANGGPH
jgi:hypothetical protein